MIKWFLFVLLIFCGGNCFSQQAPTYQATILTKLSRRSFSEGMERDTLRVLYIINQKGDSLCTYNIYGGVISSATSYNSVRVGNVIYLYTRAIYANEQPTDSLRIDFNDKDHAIRINQYDRYRLYPVFYTLFKQKVQGKNSVMAVINLLEDQIGNYPFADVDLLPLFSSQLKKEKSIQQASVITQRSQSDEIKDTWNCTYSYNKAGLLDSVGAAAGKELRFYKKISYSGSHILKIKSYTNIEDRRVTDRVLFYDPKNSKRLRWKENILETGKNRETTITVTLTKKELGQIKNMRMSKKEVLNLIKQIK